eukprot:scaffold693_cov399-Prasinococcus_capsulatus_cf.AAC.38
MAIEVPTGAAEPAPTPVPVAQSGIFDEQAGAGLAPVRAAVPRPCRVAGARTSRPLCCTAPRRARVRWPSTRSEANQTKPNQTKPNRTRRAREAKGRAPRSVTWPGLWRRARSRFSPRLPKGPSPRLAPFWRTGAAHCRPARRAPPQLNDAPARPGRIERGRPRRYSQDCITQSLHRRRGVHVRSHRGDPAASRHGAPSGTAPPRRLSGATPFGNRRAAAPRLPVMTACARAHPPTAPGPDRQGGRRVQAEEGSPSRSRLDYSTVRSSLRGGGAHAGKVKTKRAPGRLTGAWRRRGATRGSTGGSA